METKVWDHIPINVSLFTQSEQSSSRGWEKTHSTFINQVESCLGDSYGRIVQVKGRGRLAVPVGDPQGVSFPSQRSRWFFLSFEGFTQFQSEPLQSNWKRFPKCSDKPLAYTGMHKWPGGSSMSKLTCQWTSQMTRVRITTPNTVP